MNPAALKNARKQKLIRFLKKDVRYGKMTEEEANPAKYNRLSYCSQFRRSCAQADLIIEAVPEKAEIKKAVFETH